MENSALPCQVQKYLTELIKRQTINVSSLTDRMLINHLCTLRIDEDYYGFKLPVNRECKKYNGW